MRLGPLVILLVIFTSCEKDSLDPIACSTQVLVDAEAYILFPSDKLTVYDLNIQEHCLYFDFSSGGCDGSTWEIHLIDAAKIQYSNPPQRNLRLSLLNREPCDALIRKTISFDIRSIQVDGNSVMLNFENWDQPITYSY